MEPWAVRGLAGGVAMGVTRASIFSDEISPDFAVAAAAAAGCGLGYVDLRDA